jgi:NADH-quinone oxidoreductase subunit K
MASIPFEYGLLLAGVLFSLGMIGVIVRRNLLFILLCVEVMLNAAGLAFVVAGSRWGQPDGQVMYIFLLSMAAAEVAVGLALLLLHFGRRKTLDADSMTAGIRLDNRPNATRSGRNATTAADFRGISDRNVTSSDRGGN